MRKIDPKLEIALTLCLTLTATSCGATITDAVKSTETNPDMPNPASEYCQDQGYVLEILTAEDGSQSGICKFPDGSFCDEWAYFRGECQPASNSTNGDMAAPSSVLQTPPSVPTINPDDYATWWTYTHPLLGFSFKLPEDWIAKDVASQGTLSGHLLTLQPEATGDGIHIQLTFRETGEDTLLWPTGVGEGEFYTQGSLDIGGVAVQRNLLLCPSGEVTSIWYQGSDGNPAVRLGEFEFGIIYHASTSHCDPGISLSGKNQLVGEMIIASLSTP